MKNLSKHDFMRGATAISAVTALGVTNIDLMAKDKKPDGYTNQSPDFFEVPDNNNYPHFIKGDTLEIDTSVTEFQGSGWYLWGGEMWRAERSPGHHDLTLYRIKPKGIWDMDEDIFKCQGRAIKATRATI